MVRLLVVILVLVSFQSWSQSYEIKPETQRINNNKIEGYSSKVNAPVNKVEEYWLEYIKENGKTRRKRNYYQLTEFKTSKYGLDSLVLVTRVTDVDSLGKVWIGIESELANKEHEEKLSFLGEVLKKFTKSYYLYEQQLKIDASEQAAVFTSRNHEKLIKEGENLQLELNSAKGYQLRLEEQLENTILEIKVLTQKIENNKIDTEQAYQDLLRINKVLEKHKEDLKKIN